MRNWLHFALFWPGSLDQLLVDCLAGLVDDLFRLDLCSRWFFVRYWEGGQHLRLRFKAAPLTHSPLIRAQLEEVLTAYFRGIKARRRPPEKHSQASGIWSLAGGEYHPETDRYGGRQGMALAEEHFAASSAVVLQLLPDCIENESRRLPLALQLLLIQLRAARLGARQALLFAQVMANCLPAFAKGSEPSAAEEIVRRCESGFQRSQEKLIRMVNRFYSLPASRLIQDLSPPMQRWHSAAAQNWLSFVQLSKEGRLQSRALNVGGPDRRSDHPPLFGADPIARLRASLPSDDWSALRIAFSLVHMTNNRLGTTHLQEPYLAYLLARALGEALKQGSIADEPVRSEDSQQWQRANR